MVRLKILVNGIVQGVGFRPFISRVAKNYSIKGFIRNTKSGVEIEAEGFEKNVKKFLEDISKNAPPLSFISEIKTQKLNIQNSSIFEIISSEIETGNQTLISPDVSICNDCLKELFDPNNRRFLYPFINCTNCGPRLTIIENIPYDRKYTTMKNFIMCDECNSEYNNIEDRRFHAQPNACSKCGPKVFYEKNGNKVFEADAINECVKDLANGKIVAVKGLGGFHLAVDAYSEEAVNNLRYRKRREEKPFAVMMRNLEQIKQIVEVNNDEQELLQNSVSPIVLLKKKQNRIAEAVAPKNKRLGIMLAYTPLHHILMNEIEKYSKHFPPALVMTSANFSEEPIEITNEGAKEKLSQVVDGFLMHDRDILIRADDSVAIFINEKIRMFRRSRGYVPKPFFTGKKCNAVLGVGAELKNTICLIKDDKAFISQHIGDLTNFSAYEFFKESIDYFQKIIDHKAEYVAYDLHPDYLSTKWTKEINFLPRFGIQHHHAHMASCMGENNLNKDVIGIILDGTGYGIDNTIWGGEILIGNFTFAKRYSFLEPFPLPGGDGAIKEPWKIAFSYLHNSFNGDIPELNLFENFNSDVIRQMLEKKINSPITSSAGRLFDAVSVICGGPKKIRYEAQAAIEFMQLINSVDVEPYNLKETDSIQIFIPLKELIRFVVEDKLAEVDSSIISARFHKTLVELLVSKTLEAKNEFKINDVVLSGGVFQNEYLLSLMENRLRELHFNVYTNTNIPTNDGGISFGQALAANELIKNNLDKVRYEL